MKKLEQLIIIFGVIVALYILGWMGPAIVGGMLAHQMHVDKKRRDEALIMGIQALVKNSEYKD